MTSWIVISVWLLVWWFLVSTLREFGVPWKFLYLGALLWSAGGFYAWTAF